MVNALQLEHPHGHAKAFCSAGIEDVMTHCQQSRSKEAHPILQFMDQQGIQVDSSTYASLMQGCIGEHALAQGKLVHAHIVLTGFNLNRSLGTKLVTMYAKCGSLVDARRVLDEIPERNVVSWTAMIAAYSKRGYDEEALALFYQMQRTGIQPNHFTFSSVLPACATLAALEHGKVIHENIIKGGFQYNVFVESALVDMYVKCGNISEARKFFDKMPEWNIVSCNAMIAGYAQNGHVNEALKLFQQMPERDVVSWTTMIAGYAQNGYFDDALKLFRQIQLTGMKPNPDTFANVLPTCANLAALEHGKEVHEDIIRCGFQSDVFVGNALLDMYAKCGSIEDACKVFEKMRMRNVVSWTAMIVAYATHGCSKEALQLFEQMQHSGMKPTHITLVCVLTACCHAGLVSEGRRYFDCMRQYYHITPAIEHYVCMVDLLGRAGFLDEAQDFKVV